MCPRYHILPNTGSAGSACSARGWFREDVRGGGERPGVATAKWQWRGGRWKGGEGGEGGGGQHHRRWHRRQPPGVVVSPGGRGGRGRGSGCACGGDRNGARASPCPPAPRGVHTPARETSVPRRNPPRSVRARVGLRRSSTDLSGASALRSNGYLRRRRRRRWTDNHRDRQRRRRRSRGGGGGRGRRGIEKWRRWERR